MPIGNYFPNSFICTKKSHLWIITELLSYWVTAVDNCRIIVFYAAVWDTGSKNLVLFFIDLTDVII